MKKYIYNNIKKFFSKISEYRLIGRNIREKYGEITYENYCRYLSEK